MGRKKHQSDSEVETIERQETRHPKSYRVLLMNDNYTSMDFVVSVLETIFKKSPAEAVQIMLKVHKSGHGVAGVYPKQIAEAKVDLVHNRAKAEGFPLRCNIEEA
jgi:ATP-dependent Clp protease adaptor protein ClpS